MECFQSHKIFSIFLIFFNFSPLFFAYDLPDQYFINCGSANSPSLYQRSFAGDESSGKSFTISAGDSRAVENRNSSQIELYQSARIFKKSSSYDLDIDQQDGTYVVRFHFFYFPAMGSISEGRFDVLASGSSLLSNFTVEKSSNFPVIEEFLLKVTGEKLRISFKPHGVKYFAFVNAIEVFLGPPSFTFDIVISVPKGEEYQGLLDGGSLRKIHRINVGGGNITPDNDTLLRSWLSDDDYLLNKNAAKNSSVYGDKPKYQDGGSTEFDAPDFVYRTAKEMNIGSDTVSKNFNISWHFDVKKKGAKHLVRLHFCDIVSQTTNEDLKFNLYIYSDFRQEIYPWGKISQLAAPFYEDFLVDSDDSGFMNISVGAIRDSNQTAFLNGVEIMELIRGQGSTGDNGSTRKHLLLVIVGSSVGVVILVLLILAVICFSLKKRKWKPIETFDWPLVPVQGGSSYSRTTIGTITGSPMADLNLGLKIPFSEIHYSTKQFHTKLMIGQGGFGKVYKGMLRDGTKVAVKRSDPGHGQGLPEFQTEIMVLSKIRHHHLVSLIGYCDERGEMILVYEFMEKGTLRDHLYILKGESIEGSTSRTELTWDQRLRICIGAAKGLHYLHTGAAGAIIHRDIKSTNILLDEHYVAKVADFGLSRLGHLDQTHVSTDVKGSFGYLDPEYFRCLQLTQKSDVYSFGVVLLEVLCARPVIDHSLPREQVNLADWGISMQTNGKLEKIIDPLLVGKINPSSLRKFGEIVEKCLQENGSDRPNMVDVLWDLEYCLQLQHTAVPREPYEDSTSDVAWGVPMPVVQRLPSDSIRIGEDESCSFSDASAGRVFSQLNLDEAR